MVISFHLFHLKIFLDEECSHCPKWLKKKIKRTTKTKHTYIIRGSLNKFPDFFRMGTFIDSTHMKLILFEVISSGCNALVVPFQQLLKGPRKSQPLSSPQLFQNDSLWVYRIAKSHKEQGLGYIEGVELSWCPSWSNSLWQGSSCGLVYCPARNATDPIWRVLASSDRISSWTPLKPQHSNPNTNPLAYQLWSIDFLTPPTPLIMPSLNLLCYSKTDARFMQDSRKAVWSIPYVSLAFFSSLKQNFIAYSSSSCLDCIFEIHQLWQSRFSRVYSNCCCSCSFKPEIIKIGQSYHKIYSNHILKFQESMTILNACIKKGWKLIEFTTYFG